MKRSAVLLAGMLALALPVLGSEEHEDDTPERQFTVDDFVRDGVTVISAGPGTVDLGVELPGEVRPDADRIAHIAPRFPGIVREVRVHAGDRVRGGDVLAIVESEHLSKFEIRAAFDGTIIDKHIAPGEAVGHDDTAFIVADLSAVWVILDVYQEALPLVAVGRPVHIVTSHGDLAADGVVSYVSPIVDQATRTAQARVVLPNGDGRWRPGLFVTATVQDPVSVAIVAPRGAVHTFEGRPTVFAIEGNRFVARPVTLGQTGRTRVEIRDGLVAGDRIADAGSFLVKAELAKGDAGHDH